jgi:hypothetical protein
VDSYRYVPIARYKAMLPFGTLGDEALYPSLSSELGEVVSLKCANMPGQKKTKAYYRSGEWDDPRDRGPKFNILVTNARQCLPR